MSGPSSSRTVSSDSQSAREMPPPVSPLPSPTISSEAERATDVTIVKVLLNPQALPAALATVAACVAKCAPGSIPMSVTVRNQGRRCAPKQALVELDVWAALIRGPQRLSSPSRKYEIRRVSCADGLHQLRPRAFRGIAGRRMTSFTSLFIFANDPRPVVSPGRDHAHPFRASTSTPGLLQRRTSGRNGERFAAAIPREVLHLTDSRRRAA